MPSERKGAVILPPVDQVGIVVTDLDKSVEYYADTFGWGPFQVSEVDLKGCVYRGKPTDCRLKMAQTQSGPIEIELIQVLEGESPHSEFLREKGQGLHHIRFTVTHLDEVLTEWAKAGIEPVWQHSVPKAGVSWAYVNTDHAGGIMAELYEVK